MSTIRSREDNPKGARIRLFTPKQQPAVNVSTKVVAPPMPRAADKWLDTPIKGHNPKNRTSTKLLTIAALKKRIMASNTLISHQYI